MDRVLADNKQCFNFSLEQKSTKVCTFSYLIRFTKDKLIDQFTYLSNNISSTESDINTRLIKGRTAISALSTTWNLISLKKKKKNSYKP